MLKFNTWPPTPGNVSFTIGTVHDFDAFNWDRIPTRAVASANTIGQCVGSLLFANIDADTERAELLASMRDELASQLPANRFQTYFVDAFNQAVGIEQEQIV
jgi:hypothetical protein